MSMVDGSLESTWWDSRTEVMVWKLNSAHQKTDWYAWRTACDCLGVRVQQQVYMVSVEEPTNL